MKKTILTVLITAIICITGTVIASNYLASEVVYNDTTVENALNELYTVHETYKNLTSETTASSNDILNGKTAYNSSGELITGSNDGSINIGTPIINSYQGTIKNNNSTSINLTKGKYIVIASIVQSWIYGGNSAVGTNYDEQYINVTYTNNCNLHFIKTRSDQTGSLSSNNLNGFLSEQYYILDVESDTSVLNAVWNSTQSNNTGFIINLTAIPYNN